MKDKNHHTPGPWSVIAPKVTNITRIAGSLPGATAVLEVATITNLRNGMSEANAQLISAAPDLLAALEAVHCEMGSRVSPAAFAEFTESTKAAIQNALRKAKGL